ncbi:uncharacterized protein IL334_001808 [Kwoniella shivajii]|uniref:Uncharacterized protein n=1 Tax=Kwoniella shivajii TaxID=564305 RepID=A0ABZ1CX52_9TREE|nr:hypothetical protein IL334_001808 [Kwoniella shivajii]
MTKSTAPSSEASTLTPRSFDFSGVPHRNGSPSVKAVSKAVNKGLLNKVEDMSGTCDYLQEQNDLREICDKTWFTTSESELKFECPNALMACRHSSHVNRAPPSVIADGNKEVTSYASEVESRKWQCFRCNASTDMDVLRDRIFDDDLEPLVVIDPSANGGQA